jgi:putative serine protease PepD
MRLRLLAVPLAALALAACSGNGDSTANTTVPAVANTTTETTTQTTQAPPHADRADVVEQVLPSVVSITVQSAFGAGGQGSGVVIDANGTILTNNHVVEGAATVTVTLNDERELQGTVVGTDAAHDLAVVKVDATDLDAVSLGRSSELRLGDDVIALGFPLGLAGGPTVTTGIVSGLHRDITVQGESELDDLIQTDAAINPGNSGGALVDADGNLVGINSAAASASFAENVGFAIAIDEAMPIVEDILSGGGEQQPGDDRAWMGVSVGDAPDGGAFIGAVVPESPADQAGLVAGDVILKVGDTEIAAAADLTDALAEHEPGETVKVTVRSSGGDERTVDLELGTRPVTLG